MISDFYIKFRFRAAMLNIKNAEIERVLLTAKKNEKAREKAKYVLQELKKRYENRAIVPQDEEQIRKITFKIETIQKLKKDGKKVLSLSGRL